MFEIRLIFKYENKLKNLVTKTGKKPQKGGRSDRDEIVECIDNVVYEIKLPCGKCYVGQTCRCINKRLYEHGKNFKNKKKESTLVKHMLKCKECDGNLASTSVMHRSESKINRQIIEAFHIDRGGEKVISMPSVVLLECEKELIGKYHAK
jgi:hypothetical protein